MVAYALSTFGGAGGSLILTRGAQAKNVFWQISSSATIGDFPSFKGSILALTSITINSGAVLQGRLLAINGSIVLTSTNIINKPLNINCIFRGKYFSNEVPSFLVYII